MPFIGRGGSSPPSDTSRDPSSPGVFLFLRLWRDQPRDHGIQLELLSGPLQRVYDPNGAGAIVFAVLAVAAEVEREGIREKTLEGLDTAARKGDHGGRPSVVDDDKLAVARARHGLGRERHRHRQGPGDLPGPPFRHIGESA
ncbi:MULTISPECIES: recombinase family protein [unclassified Streptomyces]|uniref:recombinase family protein n=1 Tax=unclassified Streptomyces TaxID=2593676 RepID=UPI0009A0A4B6|nr:MULTISPECIES: recombinase family protein [unclassified Streptomyces]